MLPLAALYRQHAPLSPADEAGDLANATRLKARAKEIMDQQNEAETNPPFGFYTSPDARLIRNVKSMRVSAAEQARKLVTNVDAVYPEEARRASVKGKVQFQVDINLAGKVSTAKWLAGDRLLVSAALEALKKFVYETTDLNGESVRVDTEVEVAVIPR